MTHGQEKSDLFIVALKPANKPGRLGGAGGAKGEDRGEHGRATHAPDSAPDERVPEALIVYEELPVSFSVSHPKVGAQCVNHARWDLCGGVLSNGHSYRDRPKICFGRNT
jgi:hypothetical protein